ncbi:hypothetical protein D3C77_192290 [compost metagenome]
MARFIAANINDSMYCGQHYAKRSLRPGKNVYEPGLCFGFSLAWLKGIQVGHSWARLPARMDAMLVQHIYVYSNSTRSRARKHWNKEEESDLFDEEIRNRPPGASMQTPELIRCCQLYGFMPRYMGERRARDISNLLGELPARATRTYLLAAEGHAIGLALRGGVIGVFDANEGITVFKVAETLRGARLVPLLNQQLVGATYPFFGISELAF